MTAQNKNILLANTFVQELKNSGVDSVCIPPGSRSTPLTLAFSRAKNIRVFSHLDERSAAFFCLGRARESGFPTPIVSTSGTGAVNFHPAIVEASYARVPMIVLTADRPPELQSSGANQTIDQINMFTNHVRWFFQMPEPERDDRKLRSVAEKASRSVQISTGTPPGPVHLNFPFKKPLEPTPEPNNRINRSDSETDTAADSSGSSVRRERGKLEISEETARSWVNRIRNIERGFIVAGPEFGEKLQSSKLPQLAMTTGYPLLADPLSNLRFGSHFEETPILGGYDGYFSDKLFASVPEPDLVLRFGATPTSSSLQQTLQSSDAEQILVNSSGAWTDPTFRCQNLIECSTESFANSLIQHLSGETGHTEWTQKFLSLENSYWNQIQNKENNNDFEGDYVRTVLEEAPDPSLLFVSNSMPVRDLDRFGKPSSHRLKVLGNRGASGIDGITSTALGACSNSKNPLTLITGDLAFYHDMNGLLALERFDLEATVVLINNNGGGIFHMLPIEDHDPPFTELFRTPHTLRFEQAAELYNLDYNNVETVEKFRDAYRNATESGGRSLIEISVDAEKSHRERENLKKQITSSLQ